MFTQTNRASTRSYHFSEILHYFHTVLSRPDFHLFEVESPKLHKKAALIGI
jgi:hypothetical protein